jgi:murein DD-endopeptidase MepM/ murein hydrolase activator NlpD
MNQRTFVTVLVIGLLAGLGIFLFVQFRSSSTRSAYVWTYLNDPATHPEFVIQAGARCGAAPFIFPTTGMVGYLWDDTFKIGHRHQGIDIFAGTGINVTPVIAAYPGYLTRLPEWKSSVIVRVPSDPLNPGRQIWLYYTHMADSNGNSFISTDFPPGTSEQLIEAGTLLGRQGNYSGDPNNPVGVHLHFSIVRDDGTGHFKNELEITNTYDPSPYLGLALNANENSGKIPVCEPGN